MSRTTVRPWVLLLVGIIFQANDANGQTTVSNSISFYGGTYTIQTPPFQSLHISFHFSLSHGVLFAADVENIGYLTLAISNGTLETVLESNKQIVPLLSLPLQDNRTPLSSLEVSVSEREATVTLNSNTVHAILSNQLNFSGNIHLAGMPANSTPWDSVYTIEQTYIGCMTNITVNSQPVVVGERMRDGYSSGCCVPPRRSLHSSPDHSVPPELFPWRNISIEVNPVAVDEGGVVTITTIYIAVWPRGDIENRIILEVVNETQYGFFSRGVSETEVSSFRYSDLVLQTNYTIITYHHDGHEGIADSAELVAYLDCQDGGESPFFQRFTLPFTVTERNDKPYVVSQKELVIAVGTRRLITPDIITVKDVETTDSSSILYKVEQQLNARGRIVNINDPTHKLLIFNQNDIDVGKIAFQHFAAYGSEPFKFGLIVSDNSIGLIVTYIKVRPYVGRIYLTTDPSHCLFLEEGHSTIVGVNNLNSTTNFQDQNPLVSFDVTSSPKYGILEVFSDKSQLWVLINETTRSSDMQEDTIGSFTQSDIDNSHVRYVSTQEGFVLDRFHFRLRSTNFTSSNVSSICFNIIPEIIKIKPEIVLEGSTIHLEEGGRAVVDTNVLSVSLTPQEFLYGHQEGDINIEIDDVVPIFVLESEPNAGSLVAHGRVLSANESFTLDELRGGVVYYNHSSTDEIHTDEFQVRAVPTAQEVQLIQIPDPSSVVKVSVSATPLNNKMPVFTSEADIVVTEGSYTTVTRENILVEDEDLPKNRLTIFLRKPHSNKPNEIPTGYFAFSNTTINITKFTMEDIDAGNIIFVHILRESAALSFSQNLRIDDEQRIIKPKPKILIRALPHDIDVQVVRRPNSQCALYIDALLPTQTVSVSSSQFRFAIVDSFGTDVNLVPDIGVTVTSPPQNGVLYKTSFNSDMTVKSRISVSRFTVRDILMGNIEYQLKQSVFARNDAFDLSFHYGHSISENITIHVCIDPVPSPDTVLIQPASVSQKGLSNINSSHLSANDTRGGDQLVYSILKAPNHGRIVYQSDPSGNSLEVFSQAELNSNQLSYMRFDSSVAPNDTLLFKVCLCMVPLGMCMKPNTCTELFKECTERNPCTKQLSLEMITRFVNLTIINPGVRVLEGGNCTFTTQNLSVTAPPNYPDIIFYPLYESSSPLHGQLLLIHGDVDTEVNPIRFTPRDIELKILVYRNDGNEFLSDGFNLKVSAKSTNGEDTLTVTEFVRITIIPVNDHVPEFVNLPGSLRVAQGGSVQITTSLLSAHDYDSDVNDLDLIYEVLHTSPFHGYLYLDIDPNDASLSLLTWTERDIRERKLYYKQTTTGAPTDVLIFHLIDDPLNLGNSQKGATYTTINILEVVLVNNATSKSFPVTEGDSRVITFEFLSYRAENDDFLENAEIVYTVVDLPRRGFLRLDNVRLLVNEGFTQQQIHDGLLVYVHDHSNHVIDKFNYTLQVPSRGGQSQVQKYSFTIDVNIIDDDPPTVDYIMNPVLVLEQSVITIDDSVILINDYDTITYSVDTDQIVCPLIKQPMNGLIQRRRVGRDWNVISVEFTKYDIFQGNLRYNHTIIGKFNDQFRFNITDGRNYQNTTFTVNIVVLPKQLTVSVQSILVDEDGSVFLEPEHFLVKHPYLSTVPGTIRVTTSPRGGVIKNLETNEIDISTFTTEQLKNQSIVYIHRGGEDDMDSFGFIYQSHDPVGFNRMSVKKTFVIEIIGINDQPPILDPNREQRLKLWAGETKVLDETYFNVSDGDTARHQLVYHLHPAEFEFDGYVAFKNETERALSTFTQEDVSQGRIVFVHVTDQEGLISYYVTDGEITTSGNLSVDADPLLLGCDIDECMWNSPTVSRGRRVELTFSNLCCTTNDNENDRELQYHVLSKQYGIILVDSIPVDVFTKRQLEEGVVYYKHTDMDRWESTEVIRIQVRTDLDVSHDAQLSIHLDLSPRPGRPAVNSGLRVNEGDTVCLNELSLDARNLRYFAWRDEGMREGDLNSLSIQYVLSQLPKHGNLLVNYTPITSIPAIFTQEDIAKGRICYEHDNSETVADDALFAVAIVGETFSSRNQITDSLAISITPQNDIRPTLKTLVAHIQLVEGFMYTLTEDDLEVVDGDSEPSNIIIFLDSIPENADILLKQVVLNVGSNFTQSHVSMGHVTLVPHLQMSSVVSTVQFHFTDEEPASDYGNAPYEVRVTIVPHSLRVLGTRRVNYQQNEPSVKILKESLYADTNGIERETLFTVTTPPTDGELIMASTRPPVSRFTQEDIDQNRVSYVPRSDSTNHFDSFLVNVINRNLTVLNVSIEIHVLVWGRVKNTQVDFSNVTESVYLFKLPKDTIKLNVENRHPELIVLDPPKYGHLQLNVDYQDSGKITGAALTNGNEFLFHYDDLKNGWIFYSWDYKSPLNTEIVMDNFTLLVNDSSTRPGEAFIELQIVPPVLPTSVTDIDGQNTITTKSGDGSTESVTLNQNSRFPIYTLVPIVGVVCILVIMIVIVIAFCLTQQKRIRKKLQPNINPQSPQFPWSVSPPLSPPRPVVTQYTYPSALETETDDHNSGSSGFSEGEEEVPPLHSPVHSHAFSYSPSYAGPHSPSPTYSSSHVQVPLSRHPRVRSNVSITFSGRQSELSQVSVDDSSPPYGHSLVARGPANFAMPLPVRPLSHMTGVSNGCDLSYNSTLDTNDQLSSQLNNFGGAEIDIDLSHASEPGMVTVEDNYQAVVEKDNGLTSSLPVASREAQEKDSKLFGSDGSGLHTLLDLTDPNVQRLFTSAHPVLGKQEYWF